MKQDNGNHAATPEKPWFVEGSAYADLLAERDRLKAINAELVEAIEMLLVVTDAAGANKARAALDKARKEG